MIRKLLLAAAIAAATSNFAAAEIMFRGNMIFLAVNNCPASDAQLNWEFRSVFHAPLPGNSNFSAISMIYDYGAGAFRLDNAKFGPAYKIVQTGGVGWGDPYTAQRKSSVLVSSQQPATLAVNTPSVVLTGKIKNPWGQPGSENCEVTFRGVYALHQG